MNRVPEDSRESDALAEAEVYIAYGRYRRAKAVLEEAAARHPGSAALRVRLDSLQAARASQNRRVLLQGAACVAMMGAGAAVMHFGAGHGGWSTIVGIALILAPIFYVRRSAGTQRNPTDDLPTIRTRGVNLIRERQEP